MLAKSPTGIPGLDGITGGGLPKGQPTPLCGSAGCGKTLIAMEFLMRGVTEFDEPGVFVAFEERPKELAMNFAALGHNLDSHFEKPVDSDELMTTIHRVLFK